MRIQSLAAIWDWTVAPSGRQRSDNLGCCHIELLLHRLILHFGDGANKRLAFFVVHNDSLFLGGKKLVLDHREKSKQPEVKTFVHVSINRQSMD